MVAVQAHDSGQPGQPGKSCIFVLLFASSTSWVSQLREQPLAKRGLLLVLLLRGEQGEWAGHDDLLSYLSRGVSSAGF